MSEGGRCGYNKNVIQEQVGNCSLIHLLSNLGLHIWADKDFPDQERYKGLHSHQEDGTLFQMSGCTKSGYQAKQ